MPELSGAPLAQDPDELYRLLMRGAGTIPQLEAAHRLVFQVDRLCSWLISSGCISQERLDLDDGRSLPYAAVRFDAAEKRVRELSRDGRLLAEYGPGKSERAALLVAAALSGQTSVGTLRDVMPDLNQDHARLVAEAMMYAAGWMDGAADPMAFEVDGPGTGPNAVAHDRRIDGPD